MRIHLAWFAKRRERAYYRHCAFSPSTVSSWEREGLDDLAHALFWTAARKALGSCELGDTVKARPKQFRYNLRLRALPLKQLPALGKLKCNSGGVAASANGTLRLCKNITSNSPGEDAAKSRYAAATDSTACSLLARFRAFSKAKPISWKPSMATA
jgi:hypothetical protein